MPGGPRKKAGKARPGRKAAAAPRAARPALGNDPFTRGAAVRDPAEVAAAVVRPAPSPARTPTPNAAPAPAPAPAPIPTPTPTRHRAPAAPPAPSAAIDERAERAAARVVELERKLERTLDGVEGRLADLATRAGLAHARHELREALVRLLPTLRERLGSVLDLARLIEPPERLDRYGMDPRLEERAVPLVEMLYATWWRTAVRFAERIPAAGPAIVVANHAGVVPWDALVLRHALRRDHPAHRDLRPLLDDRECDLPLVGGVAVRLGAVRASAESAERILREGGLVGVFPEGSAGARKPWRDRYRIQRFGRGGFVKVALRTGAPIVPCAILGSEEASPGISRTGWLAERLGIPLLSASPVFVLSAAGAVPLPAKWSLRFGEPIDVAGRSPSDADDPAVVNALTEQVRAGLQAMLDEDVAARTSVFL